MEYEDLEDAIRVFELVLQDYEKINPYSRKGVRFPSNAEQELKKLKKKFEEKFEERLH